MKVEKVNMNSLREVVLQSTTYAEMLCTGVTMYIMINPTNKKSLEREFRETMYCGFSLSDDNRLHKFMGLKVIWTESIDLNEIILTHEI